MREGQKLFSVVRDRKQLPCFLGVADAAEDAKGLIRRGNERVLRARLEDARFFWDQDRKVPLSERAAGLKNVLFQEKLGSYDDKTQRLKKIVGYLCDKLGAAEVKADAVEAAGALQGRPADGDGQGVLRPPGPHGRPLRQAGGRSGRRPSGHLRALPAGEPRGRFAGHARGRGPLDRGQDGFDRRRASASASRSAARAIPSACAATPTASARSCWTGSSGSRSRCSSTASWPVYGDRLTLGRAEVKAACLDFFAGRLRFILEKKGYRYDLVGAALGPGVDQIVDVLARVEALDALKSSPQFEPFILMAKRINNILKGTARGQGQPRPLRREGGARSLLDALDRPRQRPAR